jgi:iron(II)-dependent oxidoreductase
MLRLLSRLTRQVPETVVASPPKRDARPVAPPAPYDTAPPSQLESDELLRLVQTGRWGYLLNQASRWQKHPGIESALERAYGAVDQEFALVPEGNASIHTTLSDAPGAAEADVATEPYLLARFQVSNAQFQNFVDCGGYEDLELWAEDVWPHLIDFKDLTDKPGPRFWRGGRHDKKLARHPVVGVCYYEAEAYAKWAGFRLPSEAEWQIAASWRINSSAYVLRRYPWGDALDKTRCNIWASGIATTVPVDKYDTGAAPNGVLQLAGNVWEWTQSDFEVTDEEGRPVVGDMLMKSIRGGAFDTYFPSQATSCFRTGQACLVRANNTGFRCALRMLD